MSPTKPDNKYRRMFVPTLEAIQPAANCVYLDTYDVGTIFDVRCPALNHALKKILCAGQRGSKDVIQDLEEARDSISRAIQIAEANQ